METKNTKRLIITANNTCYSQKQVLSTLTIDELIDHLEDLRASAGEDGGSVPVILSFDNGYTYGGLDFDDLEIVEASDED